MNEIKDAHREGSLDQGASHLEAILGNINPDVLNEVFENYPKEPLEAWSKSIWRSIGV
jgi:hypothetical protein